jgi:hypothetical protein
MRYDPKLSSWGFLRPEEVEGLNLRISSSTCCWNCVSGIRTKEGDCVCEYWYVVVEEYNSCDQWDMCD